MREILFRGKDIKGNWHIGLLAHMGNAWYISNKAGVATAYEVIPSTVGQYTGLTDKNGTRIFEGDILKHRVQGDILVERGVVEWEEQHGRWVYRLNSMKPTFYLHNPDAFEVIGNIHDNPELLKGGDENDT